MPISNKPGIEKRIFIDSLVQSPLRDKRAFEKYHVLKIERQTKRKKAQITIEVTDELAMLLMEQSLNFFSYLPIRQFRLEWVEHEPEERTQ